ENVRSLVYRIRECGLVRGEAFDFTLTDELENLHTIEREELPVGSVEGGLNALPKRLGGSGVFRVLAEKIEHRALARAAPAYERVEERAEFVRRGGAREAECLLLILSLLLLQAQRGVRWYVEGNRCDGIRRLDRLTRLHGDARCRVIDDLLETFIRGFRFDPDVTAAEFGRRMCVRRLDQREVLRLVSPTSQCCLSCADVGIGLVIQSECVLAALPVREELLSV